jgi:hypothetical protein
LGLLQGHPEWKKLKNGWPEYMDELDQMFDGVAVDGSSAYIPGQIVDVDEEDNGEEGAEEEGAELLDDHSPVTPVTASTNASLKRPNSTSTTAHSPRKIGKLKSPALRTMNRYMANNERIQEERNKYLAAAVEAKVKAKQQQDEAIFEKIKLVQHLAKECGVKESDPSKWLAVLRICRDPIARDFFIASDSNEGRLAVIDGFSRV